MKKFEIPMNGFIGWECAVCKSSIGSDNGYPASKYWNLERKEVYCSAEHSLKAHQASPTPNRRKER